MDHDDCIDVNNHPQTHKNSDTRCNASCCILCVHTYTGADPERGGGSTPTPFCANFFLKVPLIGQKIFEGELQNPLRPFFFKSWIRPRYNTLKFTGIAWHSMPGL